MTQFVTSFSSAYRQVQSALDGQKAIWSQIEHDQAEGKALPSPQELIHLHQQYKVASDLLERLSDLWRLCEPGRFNALDKAEAEENELSCLKHLEEILA